MFDDVPVRVWLVLAIAAAAYAPAAYVYRHVVHDPSRREITAPREDLSWRSTRQLVTSGFILAALAAFAIFIFTPAAERFARSPTFLPLILFALGSVSLFTVAKSVVTGTIEPLVRGFSRTYDRAAQPKRFWASATWNTALGGFFLWAAIATISSQSRDRCYDYDDRLEPPERLVSCDEILAEPDLSNEERNDAYRARAIANHQLGNPEQAIDDYNRALVLDPNDSSALHNRGLLYLEGEQFRFAVEDFTRSLALRSDNKDGYRNRASAYAALGDYSKAIADMTRVLEIVPGDEEALADRGFFYLWADDVGRAKQDFDQIRTRHPSSILLLRGEALLSLRDKDLQTADRKLREAAAREPDHLWTLRMLAEIQDRLGQPAQAEAFRRKLKALDQRQPR